METGFPSFCVIFVIMKLRSKKPVAFQGEIGAFSEMALYNVFDKKTKIRPSVSFKEVFDSIKSGKCEWGVLPVENSLGGIVYQVWDLLHEYNLHITHETKVKIEHCLIANPNAKISDIKKVFAHYQAVLQCDNFLRKHKNWVVENAYDTAGSVKTIKDLGDKSMAAIASEKASQIYEMRILAKGIQDSKENYTRFIVIGRKKSVSGNKFTLEISIKHMEGSLLEILGIASRYKINLTSIHSRPNKTKPFEYNFFLEGVCNKQSNKFFAEIKKKSLALKILGTYKASV